MLGAVTESAWNTPQRRELRETVRRFMAKDVLPYQDDWERAGELPRSLHLRAGELGLLGVSFPESVGGGGGELIDGMVVCEELHYAGCSGGRSRRCSPPGFRSRT